MAKIVIAQQFCGPPTSGNGGYVCGVLAQDIDGPATSVLRARVPLDVDLELASFDGAAVMTDADGALIGRGDSADLDLDVPAPPSLQAAQAAMGRYLAHEQRVHPICFTCDHRYCWKSKTRS